MKNFLLGLVLIFLALSIVYTTSVYMKSITGRIIQNSPYFSTAGFLQTAVSVDEKNIYLTSGCHRLAMSTTGQQTYSIVRGSENVTDARPWTHDLIKDIFSLYGIDVLMVKVDNFKDGVYYAKLLIQQGNKILNLDSRPSDAIAIAVRFRKPVYVKKDIMEKFGQRIC